MGGVWSLLLQIKEDSHDADENQARLGKVLLVLEQFVVAEEQARRLETAKSEFDAQSEFDVTIVNDDVDAAAEAVVHLMTDN